MKVIIKKNKLLILILLFAFFLRVWGINSPTYADEHFLVNRAIRMIDKFDLNPHFFSWPTFYFYILAIFYLPYKAMAFFFDNSLFSFYTFARFLSAFLGTATVFATYLIAKRLFGKGIALLSAIVFSLIFIHVVDSHYIILDVPMTLLTAFSFYTALGIIKDGRPKDYLWTGFLIGLANSTKYNFPLVLILPVAHLLRFWQGKPQNIPSLLFSSNLWKGVALILLGFLLGTPFALFDWKTFLWGAPNASEPEGLLAIIFYVNDIRATFASNANGLPTWLWLVEYLLFSGLYLPFFLSTFLGIILFFRKPSKEKTFFLFWLFLFLFVFSTLKTRFDRYLLPATPFFAIASGYFLNFLFQRISQVKMLLVRKALFFLVVVCFFGVSLLRVLAFDWLIWTPDTRVEAANWLAKTYPKETPILAIDDALRVGQQLQLRGFDNVVNLFPFTDESVFLYPGEILVVDSVNYHIAENYQNVEKYRRFWENYQKIKNEGQLIKKFSRSLFESGFFSPTFLEHSSTVNAYHNPTVEIYRIPELGEISKREFSYEYSPEKMSTDGLVLEKSGKLVIMPRIKTGLLIAGPHEIFPKGEYLLEYQLAEVKCLFPKGQITIKITSSGGQREFAKTTIFCPLKEGNFKIDLPVTLQGAERLEFVFSSTPGIDFLVEKAVFRRQVLLN